MHWKIFFIGKIFYCISLSPARTGYQKTDKPEIILFLINLHPITNKMGKHLSNQKKIKDRAIVEPLISMLNNFHTLDEKVIRYLCENIAPVSFKRGTRLQEAGTHCEYIYFIKKGVLRGFILQGHKEVTTWISADNELVTSISSLDLELPAFENIQAIENCELLSISIEAMNNLYLQFTDFNIVGRKLWQQYYRDAEKRAYIVRLIMLKPSTNFLLKTIATLLIVYSCFISPISWVLPWKPSAE